MLSARWSARQIVVLAALLAMPVSGLAYQDIEEVTVEGEGISKESARRDALRNALETAGRITISSHSQVDNFELIRDTIYSKAEGIVTDYKILDQREAAGGTFICRIRAKVSKSAIADTWGAVQNVLDQVGRPGIAVYIQERVDGRIQDSSILESRIEKRLLDKGFVVYSGSQIRAIAERESADAQAEGDVVKMQGIAKDFGTQIFITGTAQANAAGVRDLYGQLTAMYNCDADIRMYYTDTGELIASEALPNTRGGARGAREHSPQAGKKALANAGEEIVEECYRTVMRRWATRISAGGELLLEVSGMSMLDALKLKRKLQAIDADRILNVTQSFTKGTAKYRIKAKMTAEALAEHLLAQDFANDIELVDLKTNRIQAKKVGP